MFQALGFEMQIMSRKDALEKGLVYYFSGVPCKRGHLSERWSKVGSCVECHKAATKRWKENNKEKELEREAKRRQQNPTRCNKYKEEWKRRNAEKVLEQSKQYYKANAEKIREKSKIRRGVDENKEKQRIYTNEWRRANPAAALVQVNKRRALRINACVAWADNRKILAIYAEAKANGFTVDHIIPLNNPLVCGLHVPENMQLLTASENSAKGNRFIP